MKCEVIAAIKGLQFLEGEEGESIETLTPAQYYFRGGSHYLIYEEADEDSGRTTKNTIKFKDHMMELTKKGLINVHMVFEEQKKNMTSYGTPFGNIMVGINASCVKFEEREELLSLYVEYALDVNYERFADCKIQIEIRPREEGGQFFSVI